MAISCNQCNMLAINGVPCHETGCPNERKVWDAANEEWVMLYECKECGCKYDHEEEAADCCKYDHEDEEDDDPDRLEMIEGLPPFFDVDPEPEI